MTLFNLVIAGALACAVLWLAYECYRAGFEDGEESGRCAALLPLMQHSHDVDVAKRRADEERYGDEGGHARIEP